MSSGREGTGEQRRVGGFGMADGSMEMVAGGSSTETSESDVGQSKSRLEIAALLHWDALTIHVRVQRRHRHPASHKHAARRRARKLTWRYWQPCPHHPSASPDSQTTSPPRLSDSPAPLSSTDPLVQTPSTRPSGCPADPYEAYGSHPRRTPRFPS